MVILENIDIDIDKAIFQNIEIDSNLAYRTGLTTPDKESPEDPSRLPPTFPWSRPPSD